MLSMVRLAGVPVFLWLVLGPEADGWALGAADGLGRHRLPRRLPRPPARPDLRARRDPRPGRRPALHPRRRRSASPCATSSRGGWRSSCRCATCCCGGWCRSCAPAATARCRCTSSARPPRSTCSTPSRCCCSATARASSPTLADVVRLGVRVLGDRPLLVGRRPLRLAGAHAAARHRAAYVAGDRPMAEPVGAPSAPLPEHVTTPLLTLITARSLDEDYAHVAQQRGARRADAGRARPRPALGEPRWRSRCFGVLVARRRRADRPRRRRRRAEPGRADRADRAQRATSSRDLQARRSRELPGANQAVADAAARRSRRSSTTSRPGVRRRRAQHRLRRRCTARASGSPSTTRPASTSTSEVRDEDLALAGRRPVGGRRRGDRDQRPAAHRARRRSATPAAAIHVNSRPLTPPYVVQAIGDPGTLQARLLQTSQGQAWFAPRRPASDSCYTSENVDDIRLPAAPGAAAA